MNHQIKDKIRSKFNRAALTYDQHCMVQQAICKRSMQLLLKYQNHFDSIADFACGTGESTHCLTQTVNFNKCYAMDLAEQLLLVAKNKLSHVANIEWIQHDFDQPVSVINRLDLIFCNMGLQWSSDFSTTVGLWEQYLNKNGLLLFSMPITGNFPEITESCKPVLLNHRQVIDSLSANYWKLIASEVEFFEESFNSQIEALKALKATGTNYNKTNVQLAQGLSPIKLEQIFLQPNCNKLTYKIGIYLVMKCG